MNIAFSCRENVNYVSEFIKNTNHNVHVAAYSSSCLDKVTWTLDSLHVRPSLSAEIQEWIGLSKSINKDNLLYILDDISKLEIDLIISDFEPIFAYIAKALDIPLIHCSSYNLFNSDVTFSKFIYESIKRKLELFEHAENHLIYSPFGFLDIDIPSGYEWTYPYEDSMQIDSKIARFINREGVQYTYGKTAHIAAALKSEMPLFVANHPDSIEECMNSKIIDEFRLGKSIGYSDKNFSYIKRKIDIFNKDIKYSFKNDYKYLHERLL